MAKPLLAYIITIWTFAYTVYSHGIGSHDHSHDDFNLGKWSRFNEFMSFINQYDYKVQAIVASLVIQTVPVILMSITYSFLSKFVKDPEHSWLLQGMYAFTFGALMGDVFMHIMPSLNSKSEDKAERYDFAVYINIFIIAGVIFWYLLESIISIYFHSDHDHKSHADAGCHAKDTDMAENDSKKTSAFTLALFGDFFHNFTDGLAVASTFTLSPKLGIITSAACFVHEIPHEVGDFAYAFKNGYSYWQALGLQMLTGMGALIGTLISLAFSKSATEEMVALSGGTFIYMSLWIFLEEIRHKEKISYALINIVFMALGLFSMHCVAQFE